MENLLILKNGLKIIHKNYPGSGIVDVRITLAGGVIVESENGFKPGTAHLTEHILNNFDDDDFSTSGGQQNAFTFADEKMTFFATVLKDKKELAFKRICRILSKDSINENSFLIQKKIIESEILESSKKKNHLKDLLFRSSLYGNTRYSSSVLGSVGTLEKITLLEVRDYANLIMSPNNLVISVYGDINIDEVKSDIEKYFSQLNLPLSTIKHGESISLNSSKKLIFNETQQASEYSTLLYGGLINGRYDKLFPSTVLLLNYLTNGPYSVFNVELRNVFNVTYHVKSVLSCNNLFGVFYFELNTHKDNVQKVIDTINNSLGIIASNSISHIDLEKLKNKFFSDLLINNQTIQRQAQYDSDIKLNYPEFKDSKEYLMRFVNVSKDDISLAAQAIKKSLNTLLIESDFGNRDLVF